MDLCKALVSGPAGTPYALGLFEFDVFFPDACECAALSPSRAPLHPLHCNS